MSNIPVTVSIPFESLAQSISSLDLREKIQIAHLLEEQIAQAEESLYASDPAIQNEIREARIAYQAGDVVSIDDYIKKIK